MYYVKAVMNIRRFCMKKIVSILLVTLIICSGCVLDGSKKISDVCTEYEAFTALDNLARSDFDVIVTMTSVGVKDPWTHLEQRSYDVSQEAIDMLNENYECKLYNSVLYDKSHPLSYDGGLGKYKIKDMGDHYEIMFTGTLTIEFKDSFLSSANYIDFTCNGKVEFAEEGSDDEFRAKIDSFVFEKAY